MPCYCSQLRMSVREDWNRKSFRESILVRVLVGSCGLRMSELNAVCKLNWEIAQPGGIQLGFVTSLMFWSTERRPAATSLFIVKGSTQISEIGKLY